MAQVVPELEIAESGDDSSSVVHSKRQGQGQDGDGRGIEPTEQNLDFSQAIDPQTLDVDLTNLRLNGIPSMETLTSAFLTQKLNISINKIKRLVLRHNFISSLIDLGPLESLEEIDLYENHIQTINNNLNVNDTINNKNQNSNNNNSTWPWPLNIKIIDLSFNLFRTIQGVSNLPLLTDLYLVHNKISEIPLNGLINLPSLKQIELGSNRIRKIENLDGMNHLPSLTHLWLGKNKISIIEGLNSLKNLKIISLQSNRITEIGNGLEACTLLEELYLSNNAITHIQGLTKASFLRVLDLGSNRISVLSTELLQNQKLQELWMNDNLIGSWPATIEVIGALPSLTSIYLEHNPIYTAVGREEYTLRIREAREKNKINIHGVAMDQFERLSHHPSMSVGGFPAVLSLNQMEHNGHLYLNIPSVGRVPSACTTRSYAKAFRLVSFQSNSVSFGRLTNFKVGGGNAISNDQWVGGNREGEPGISVYNSHPARPGNISSINTRLLPYRPDMLIEDLYRYLLVSMQHGQNPDRRLVLNKEKANTGEVSIKIMATDSKGEERSFHSIHLSLVRVAELDLNELNNNRVFEQRADPTDASSICVNGVPVVSHFMICVRPGLSTPVNITQGQNPKDYDVIVPELDRLPWVISDEIFVEVSIKDLNLLLLKARGGFEDEYEEDDGDESDSFNQINSSPASIINSSPASIINSSSSPASIINSSQSKTSTGSSANSNVSVIESKTSVPNSSPDSYSFMMRNLDIMETGFNLSPITPPKSKKMESSKKMLSEIQSRSSQTN